jgi:hypothetical protein
MQNRIAGLQLHSGILMLVVLQKTSGRTIKPRHISFRGYWDGRCDFFEIYAITIQTGICVRDFGHVKDMAEAHLLALVVQVRSRMPAYDMGTGTSYSARQVCDVVERELDWKINFFDVRHPEVRLFCASPHRLMRELGSSKPILRLAGSFVARGNGARAPARPL